MCKRISGSDEQESSECSVDADDHRQVVGTPRMPGPTGGLKDRQWVDGKDKYEADHLQRDP